MQGTAKCRVPSEPNGRTRFFGCESHGLPQVPYRFQVRIARLVPSDADHLDQVVRANDCTRKPAWAQQKMHLHQ